jgi:uncharacterized protein (TIGR02757 family)
VAAVVAAMLAFGNVVAMGRAIAEVLDAMDASGGPARFCAERPERARASLAHFRYRWIDGRDILDLCEVLGRAQRQHGTLGAVFGAGPPRASLASAMGELRRIEREAISPRRGPWFPSPEGGSACKRWCMLLRWMVRTGPPDLGRWTHLDPADLVIPLDTHVMRVAGFLGLTERRTAGWAAAEEITSSLRRLDPRDPVRFDFALAHLGISGACRGYRHRPACASCALDPVCGAPSYRKFSAQVRDRRPPPASRS